MKYSQDYKGSTLFLKKKKLNRPRKNTQHFTARTESQKRVSESDNYSHKSFELCLTTYTTPEIEYVFSKTKQILK